MLVKRLSSKLINNQSISHFYEFFQKCSRVPKSLKIVIEPIFTYITIWEKKTHSLFSGPITWIPKDSNTKMRRHFQVNGFTSQPVGTVWPVPGNVRVCSHLIFPQRSYITIRILNLLESICCDPILIGIICENQI